MVLCDKLFFLSLTEEFLVDTLQQIFQESQKLSWKENTTESSDSTIWIVIELRS